MVRLSPSINSLNLVSLKFNSFLSIHVTSLQFRLDISCIQYYANNHRHSVIKLWGWLEGGRRYCRVVNTCKVLGSMYRRYGQINKIVSFLCCSRLYFK